jgi:hypothetical protein
MTRSLTICVLAVLLPSVSVADPPAAHLTKLSDSIEREAIRLARSDEARQAPQDRSWAHVMSLKPDTDVLLTTRGAPAARRVFLNADASFVNTLNLSTLPLRTEEFNLLRKMASERPLHLIAGKGGQTVIDGPLEIRSGSVFYQSRRIALIDDLVVVVPREDVTRIETKDAPHLSAGKAALIGAVAGGVFGAILFAPPVFDWRR